MIFETSHQLRTLLSITALAIFTLTNQSQASSFATQCSPTPIEINHNGSGFEQVSIHADDRRLVINRGAANEAHLYYKNGNWCFQVKDQLE